jgi:hypothetical protein
MAHFQFRTRPATVGSIVAQGDSAGSGCRFDVHAAVAFTVCPVRGA